MLSASAKFSLGQVVRHRVHSFRGVIFDVDPQFNNTEEWWESIPEDIRPAKDQPFYHLFAENDDTEYVAYVSEQNLVADVSGQPIRHPQVRALMAERLEGVFERTARSMGEPDGKTDAAVAAWSTMLGGLLLARVFGPGARGDEILAIARQAALACGPPRDADKS